MKKNVFECDICGENIECRHPGMNGLPHGWIKVDHYDVCPKHTVTIKMPVGGDMKWNAEAVTP